MIESESGREEVTIAKTTRLLSTLLIPALYNNLTRIVIINQKLGEHEQNNKTKGRMKRFITLTSKSSLRKGVWNRILREVSNIEKPTYQWLQQKGYKDDHLIQGILNAFGGNPSIDEINQLGETGLKSLVEAVTRELKGSQKSTPMGQSLTLHIALPRGQGELTVEAREGESFLDVILRNQDLAKNMECSCRGCAACSTCHLYVHPDYVKRLPPPDEAELDMLDLAWGFNKEQSRLGCQIHFKKDLDGLRVTIPDQVHDLYK